MPESQSNGSNSQVPPPEAEPDKHEPVQDTQPPVYSAFTKNQKKGVIIAASVASFFSPLTANIYLPALNTFADALHVTNSQINLTVTLYSVFQGVTPPFIAAFSDAQGRRLAYIGCFLFYLFCNIGLALQNSYAALMVLRALQSATISGTVAITQGSVADMITSAERGSYIGYMSIGSIIGPAISPVLGGLISQYLGWRWIFWFLVICAAAYVIPTTIFMPETCRKVVGDGSIPPPIWNQSIVGYFREKRLEQNGTPLDYAKRDELAAKRKLRFPNPFRSLVIIFTKHGSIILLSVGLLYASFYFISSSIPSQFAAVYDYNNLHISLMYIPIAAGSLISAFTTGKLLNWNFRRHAHRLGVKVDKSRQTDLAEFPVERARLEIALPFLLLGAGGVVGFGWCVEAQTSVAGPIVMIFLVGYGLIAGFQAMSALLIDLFGKHPASASAANNLVRCLLAAVASAVVIPMIEAMGIGWTCTTAALIWVGFSPLLVLLCVRGHAWRRAKAALEKRKQAKEAGHEGAGQNTEQEDGKSE